jgi:histidine triad (HIT) family protein
MNQNRCIFCAIIEKSLPAKIVKEHPDYMAIRDIRPQAPCHVLVVPRQHIANLTQFQDAGKLGQLFQAATEIALQENLSGGFRVVVNTGNDAGQTVDHLHIHVLGGRALGWPPG